MNGSQRRQWHAQSSSASVELLPELLGSSRPFVISRSSGFELTDLSAAWVFDVDWKQQSPVADAVTQTKDQPRPLHNLTAVELVDWFLHSRVRPSTLQSITGSCELDVDLLVAVEALAEQQTALARRVEEFINDQLHVDHMHENKIS